MEHLLMGQHEFIKKKKNTFAEIGNPIYCSIIDNINKCKSICGRNSSNTIYYL